jgi:hypothetical protein
MQYKKINPAVLRLEYACPFCLSAKFGSADELCKHIAGACQGAAAILTDSELACADADLQIGEDMALNDYIADEEAYYKNMVSFASADAFADLQDRSADEVLEEICRALKAADHPEKNLQIAGWRIMATFFQLEDEVMERYLQIIYGDEGEDSEDEGRWVHPAPEVAGPPEDAIPASTRVIVNKIE